MKKIILLGLVAVFLSLALVQVGQAVAAHYPNCEVVDISLTSGSCPSDKPFLLMKLSSSSNAHGELASQTGYDYGVCCSGPSLGSTCPPTPDTDNKKEVVLKLSGNTNAHVEKESLSNYNTKVCLSSSAPTVTKVECDYAYSCSNLGSNYMCIVELSGNTNAHLGECTASTTSLKACCRITEDTTSPAGGSVTPSGTVTIGGSQYFTSGLLSLSLNPGTDPESGISSVQLYKDTATLSGNSCGTFANNWVETGTQSPTDNSESVPVSSGKCYKFKYTARNGAGLSADYFSSDIVKVDASAPTGVSISYTEGFTSQTTKTITLSPGTDTQTGISSAQLEKRESPLSGGVCGAVSSWQSLGTQSPTDTSYAAELSGGKCYQFRYTTKNGANLQASTQSDKQIKVDTVKPSTSDNVGTEDYPGRAEIELTCSDSHSGCQSIKYCYYTQGQTPCTPTNEYDPETKVVLNCGADQICKQIVRYYSTDTAGNQETIQDSRVVTMDTTRHSCKIINTLPQYTKSNSVSLEWDYENADAGDITGYKIEYQVDGENWETWKSVGASTKSDTFANMEEGKEYTFSCFALVGSDTGIRSSRKVTTVDTLAPTIEIDALPKYTNEDAVSVSWDSNDATSGIESLVIEMRKDSGTTKGTWESFATKDDSPAKQLTSVEEGKTYVFRGKGTDKAGNAGEFPAEADLAFTTIDTVAPACEIKTIANSNAGTGIADSVTENPFYVSWLGSDSTSGVESYLVEYSTDSSTWNEVTSIAGDATAMQFSGIEGNTYYFRCTATDFAGNEGQASEVESTTLDMSGPEITAEFEDETGIAQDLEVTLSAQADPEGVKSLEVFFIDEKIGEMDPSDQGKTTVSLKVKIESSKFSGIGNYEFTVKTEDMNGNIAEEDFEFEVFICVAPQTRACGSNIGECKSGTQACKSDNTWGVCEGGKDSSVEICDNKDNDCDSNIDEGLTRDDPLGTNVGVCVPGTQTCAAGKWGPPTNGVYPKTEFCGDNKDNDCDGTADEECVCDEGQTRSCGLSSGICTPGTQTCVAGKWGSCTGGVQSQTEICDDGLDNDCDGSVDEDCALPICSDGAIPSSGCACEGAGYTYGYCCQGQHQTTMCESGTGPGPTPPDTTLLRTPWIWLSVAGLLLLVGLAIAWRHFKKKGKDLTWNEVQKKWSK